MRFNRALPLIPLLAACATPQGEYPSLNIRPQERASGTLQPPPTPYVPPPTPAPVLDRLEQLAADAAAAHQAFLAEAPAARSAVAAAGGAAEGSDGWARASVALAGLESARSKAMIALADLDRLMVDAAVEGRELERIVAVRDRVIAQVDEQNRTIEGLQRSLR
jgi:hypothetical protein